MLTSKHQIRIDLPHEPGEWIEARKPSISMLLMGGVTTVTLLQTCITAWSYPEPVTPENIADLDVETAQVVARALGTTPEAETKNSSALSTAA